MTLALLVLAPAANATSALDRYVQGSSSTLSLQRGVGTAIVRSDDGAMLGTMRSGRIVIFDAPRGAVTEMTVSGCTMRRIEGSTTVCRGQNLSFSIVDGRWRVTLQGRGIHASAVVRGWARLRGTRGTYRIDDGPRRRWPRFARTFTLG